MIATTTMSWLRISALLVLLAALFPAFLTGSTAQSDDAVLRVQQWVYPDVVDPQKSGQTNELAILSLIYEGLTRLDTNQETIPPGTSLGAHTLAAMGTAPSGRTRVAYAAINVVSAGTNTTTTGALPRTGSDNGRLVAVGGALILLGGAALAGSIKSRRNATA